MSAVSAPHSCRIALATLRRHLRRALGRDPSPLCRRVDRARSRLVVALLLACAGALALATAVGLLAAQHGQSTALRTARHRHQVAAVTVGPALPIGTASTAEATWTYPLSDRHRGLVVVPDDIPVGGTVAVWVDDLGLLAAPPRPSADIVADAVSLGLMTLAGVSLSAGALYTVRRRGLDHRAGESWESDWERVEPLWSGRARGRG
ncbi:Rv1733c family protein [Kitasatospora sp. HPMI-4]|uniref:Rv1733c family protein n=1 Tax=Kitasatospora sp. HPMI-4 TaxID=3448443 RepID=UPI003F1DAE5F